MFKHPVAPGGMLEGYYAPNGILEPSIMVAAYAARGQNVVGRCTGSLGDCRRTVTIDSKALCGKGLGRLSMTQVQRTFACHRLDGCNMAFHDTDPDYRLRMRDLTGKGNVRIRLRCRGCKLVRAYAAEAVVAKLRAAAKGDDQTEIKGLGAKIKGACPGCGKSNWEADVLWANMDTMGWKQMGDRVFEGMLNR